MNIRGKKIKIVLCILAGVFISIPTSIAIIDEGSLNQGMTLEQIMIDEDNNTPQLPYWLNGTILDGTHRVVVSENGLPPPFQNPNSYDYIITFETEQQIVDAAKQSYINTYGINPCKAITEPEQTNSTGNSSEYYDLYLKLYQQYGDQFTSDIKITGNGHPHAYSGQMYTLVFPATNSRDRPNQPQYLVDRTQGGFNAFQQFNNLQTLTYGEYGYWDASNVPSGSDIRVYDNDLYADLSANGWLDDAPSTFLVGWIKATTGDAGCGGGWSCAMRENNLISKSVLAQHEISHILEAPDHGWQFWPPCVMSYFWYIFLQHRGWCSTCQNTIYNAIWNE